MPAEDLVFTAKWELVTYTITCNLAGGSVETPNPTEYTFESDAITLTNPTREGYTFAGWKGDVPDGTMAVKNVIDYKANKRGVLKIIRKKTNFKRYVGQIKNREKKSRV